MRAILLGLPLLGMLMRRRRARLGYCVFCLAGDTNREDVTARHTSDPNPATYFNQGACGAERLSRFCGGLYRGNWLYHAAKHEKIYAKLCGVKYAVRYDLAWRLAACAA